MTEDDIWNTITDSAKKRFDYSALEEEMPYGADTFLFQIVMGLAFEESKDIAALKVMNNFLVSGVVIKKDEILQFMADNKSALGLEILASQIAGDMFNNGEDPTAVLVAISQVLTLNPAHASTKSK